jgi:hypothetical protein
MLHKRNGNVICAGAGIAQVAYRLATGATAEGSKFESRSQDVFYVVRANTKNFFILLNSIFFKYFLRDQNVQLQKMHPFGSAMSSSNNPKTAEIFTLNLVLVLVLLKSVQWTPVLVTIGQQYRAF